MHAHMLNPRAFLKDTIRCNISEYWTAGMPWQAVNKGIASNFSENANPMTKFLKSIGTIGSGYGDGNFSHQCPSCNRTVNKELLSLHKFIQDTVLLLGKGVPMPGTVLDIQSGKPQLVPDPAIMPNYTRTFPNRMIQLKLRIKVMNLINPSVLPKVSGSHPFFLVKALLVLTVVFIVAILAFLIVIASSFRVLALVHPIEDADFLRLRIHIHFCVCVCVCTAATVPKLGGGVVFDHNYPVPQPKHNEVLAKVLYSGVFAAG
ncbi:hypothetical protein MKX07_006690 [Trichoderma sp. CBMAI-0711]|nr:hypothetical protein MKX07_006690 [Trichoderma sp. CBMAI-0711]